MPFLSIDKLLWTVVVWLEFVGLIMNLLKTGLVLEAADLGSIDRLFVENMPPDLMVPRLTIVSPLTCVSPTSVVVTGLSRLDPDEMSPPRAMGLLVEPKLM